MCFIAFEMIITDSVWIIVCYDFEIISVTIVNVAMKGLINYKIKIVGGIVLDMTMSVSP